MCRARSRSIGTWSGLSVALELPERDAAFLWIGERGRSMLGLWGIGSAVNSHDAAHRVRREWSTTCSRRRSGCGTQDVTPLSFFGAETDEPDVLAWMPAAAVYFEDPDGHLLEYLAMLDQEPRPDAGIVPWSEWYLDKQRDEIRSGGGSNWRHSNRRPLRPGGGPLLRPEEHRARYQARATPRVRKHSDSKR